MISQLSLFFLLLLPPAISSTPVPKSGCPDRCGNVSISFPFGLGSDCSLDPSFNITCNTSTHPQKAYLYSFDSEIVEINPSQVRVLFPDLLGLACYNESGDFVNGSADSWQGFSTGDGPYTFSDDNWLTAIGCDDLVLGIGYDNTTFGSGCVSYCKNETGRGNGFCPENDIGYPPGKGCCRTTVPKGINVLGAQLTNLGTKWRDKKLFTCSYAFVQEKLTSNHSNFLYPLSYLNNPNEFLDENWRWKKREMTPVVRLDWRINGAENCKKAQQNKSSYACRDNTECVDFHADVGGYRCTCKNGYKGNPYKPGGCHAPCARAESRCDNKLEVLRIIKIDRWFQ